jgi:NAD(P)-dependent dehydrogenase (short-subunit alcohol dehydrogenase family)
VFGALRAAEDTEARVVGVAVSQGLDLGGELFSTSTEGPDVVGAVGWAGVEDVAKAVVFLASDDAAYVNAATIMVDGGATVYMPSAQRRSADG